MTVCLLHGQESDEVGVHAYALRRYAATIPLLHSHSGAAAHPLIVFIAFLSAASTSIFSHVIHRTMLRSLARDVIVS
jgi:hypothetical protein